MPFCSTSSTAFDLRSSSLMSLPASSSVSSRNASRIRSRRGPGLPSAQVLEHALELAGHLLHAGRGHDLDPRSRACSTRSRAPARRASPRAASCGTSAGWRRTRRRRPRRRRRRPRRLRPARGAAGCRGCAPSAASSARRRTLSVSRSRPSFTATSVRSRTMDSTSRPTYPTSVNLVASILMNGAPARRARRRAISVFPTPVGPIIRMFFGVISARISSPTCIRRQRLRSAIATARFASACPTMCLSSSWTISLGVIGVIVPARVSWGAPPAVTRRRRQAPRW